MARNKKKDPRYSKSIAVKESAKNAAKASALKRRQQKEERERLAGDQEPEPANQDEPPASEDEGQKAGTEEEEPVVEPLIPKDLRVRLERLVLSPATLQRLTKKRKGREDSSESGSSPPKRTRSKTRRPTRAGSSSETANPDGEVTRYFTGKKNFEVPMTFLEFKQNVTMGLLSHALNENKNQAGRAGRMMPTIHPSAEPGAKRRKIRLSVRDDIQFTGVGLHLPIFGEARGRCEWCQATTKTKLESKTIFKKINCFVEYHDENYLFEEEAPLAEVEAVYSASEESDGQASDHEPTNKECSSSSADSDELEDSNRRDGFIIDEYGDFQE
ncbi:hypothetical protein DAPPUDRAFT_115360 [Daphnia pulex]|uniref:Uncharacterized protein n=1 Tax=Daphnia pulex TaxID=6669 RepID=E9HL41_DAPPU|nr:hypothetical protein DAPPUDRAFT_115360 [Daphnia pulex]|eukprot:EFX67539.1 hypothetical protein DAPPUDRAFT_115360 [Daphnia pulex]